MPAPPPQAFAAAPYLFTASQQRVPPSCCIACTPKCREWPMPAKLFRFLGRAKFHSRLFDDATISSFAQQPPKLPAIYIEESRGISAMHARWAMHKPGHIYRWHALWWRAAPQWVIFEYHTGIYMMMKPATGRYAHFASRRASPMPRAMRDTYIKNHAARPCHSAKHITSKHFSRLY